MPFIGLLVLMVGCSTQSSKDPETGAGGEGGTAGSAGGASGGGSAGEAGESSGGASAGGTSGGSSGGSSGTGGSQSGGSSGSGGTPSCSDALRAPALELDPIACPTTRVISLLNDGDDPVEVVPVDPEEPIAYTGGEFPGEEGTCRSFITPGEVCDIEVTITPADGPRGAFSGGIEIDYESDCGTSTLRIPVTATLQRVASVTPSPAPLDFGEIDSPVEQTLTLTNEGDLAAALTPSAASFSVTDFAFVGDLYPGGGDCGNAIAPGESCSIGVAFAPTSVGTSEGALGVPYTHGCGDTTATAALVGRAASTATFNPAGANVTQPNRTCPAQPAQTWTMTNDGVFALTDIAVSVESAVFEIETNTCDTSLAPSESCRVTIRDARSCHTVNFRDSATLTVEYNDGQPQTFTSSVEVYISGCASCP